MAVIKDAKSIATISNNLDCLQALPSPGDVFVCRDTGRMDIYGEFITDVHIRVKRDTYDQKVWFYCFGEVKENTICFGAAETLEGACDIIDGLEPYDTEADYDPEETKEVPW